MILWGIIKESEDKVADGEYHDDGVDYPLSNLINIIIYLYMCF